MITSTNVAPVGLLLLSLSGTIAQQEPVFSKHLPPAPFVCDGRAYWAPTGDRVYCMQWLQNRSGRMCVCCVGCPMFATPRRPAGRYLSFGRLSLEDHSAIRILSARVRQHRARCALSGFACGSGPWHVQPALSQTASHQQSAACHLACGGGEVCPAVLCSDGKAVKCVPQSQLAKTRGWIGRERSLLCS
jgi:hypothetical protein